jgi:hypothetical protein
MSARLSTQGKYSIRYGKVEVRAKLPRGCVICVFCVLLLTDIFQKGLALAVRVF